MADEHMLTTVDNPYNPYDDFDEWNAYDVWKGYNSLAFLSRVARTSSDLSVSDNNLALELAIDEIIREDIWGIYTKVAKPSNNPYDDPALSMVAST